MGEPIFNHTAHKALWDWLSKNQTKEKWDWPGWEENGGVYKHCVSKCFACSYVFNKADAKALTQYYKDCPLTGWETPDNSRVPCMSHSGLYERWMWDEDVEMRAKLAEKIRDLPVRDGVKCA